MNEYGILLTGARKPVWVQGPWSSAAELIAELATAGTLTVALATRQTSIVLSTRSIAEICGPNDPTPFAKFGDNDGRTPLPDGSPPSPDL